MRLLLLCLTACGGLAPGQDGSPPLSFNRSVRPILAETCFPCHGPDGGTRQADLRLDRREDAFSRLPSGNRAVVPGDPDASTLMARLRHHDVAERMPPASSHRTISPEDIDTLERWIREGANWEPHWAFIPPQRPAVPAVADRAQLRSPIDAFVTARLERMGIRPSPQADRHTLARRLAVDLTGLPPAPEDVATLTDDAAYTAYVDRLLASPHFGERLAVFWLDLVRYADTSGYHGDQPISFWPYRDWVIKAFNEGLPFDQFTEAQLAGDLLPEPTRDQLVASGYNHLNQKTSEGGAQDKEYLAIYRADRVRTAASVWMGVTLGCAQCHDHKFDPFTAEDFYSFAAIFEDINEKGYYAGSNWSPTMPVPSADQSARIAALDAQVKETEGTLNRDTEELRAARASWAAEQRSLILARSTPVLGPWSSSGPYFAKNFNEAYATPFDPEKGADVPWTPRPAWKDGVVHNTLKGDNAATYLRRTITVDADQTTTLSLGSDDAIKVWIDGREVFKRKVTRGAQPDQDKVQVELLRGEHELLMKIANGAGGYGFYFRLVRDGPPNAVVEALRAEPSRRTPAQRDTIAAHYRTVAPALAAVRAELKALRDRLTKTRAAIPTTLISRAMTPRPVKVLHRGDWQDESGPVVQPRGPSILADITANGDRTTRLDLARWLTSGRHPLTARVFVNRLWRLFFGTGLSRTVENLGTQGEWPVDQDLLDWLAVEFVDSGWDVKHMIRLMVNSTTYRRSSQPRPDLAVTDPENRSHARQSTWRLDAEFVRDQALVAAALLNRDIGGPSSKPYQPAGYWRELNFPKRVYKHDTTLGKQHRRGLYTWWQRSFLHPSLKAFDAPPREECTAARPRSNTPLQALVLLNDPSYVEAARALADRVLGQAASSDAERLALLYRYTLARTPKPAEEAALLTLLATQRQRFEQHPDAARSLTDVGLSPRETGHSITDHAAWTQVARAILNLHEVITRS